MDSTSIRNTAEWKRLHWLIQNERYAAQLLTSILSLRGSAYFTPEELAAFHGGYDHMILFRAQGSAIKGEDTENTKLVVDILYRNRNGVRPFLDREITTLIDLDNAPGTDSGTSAAA